MTVGQEIAGPPATLRFRRRVRPVPTVVELWRARELVRSLAERDLRARYKQAVLGFGWAIITPLLLMIVFTLVFNRVAKIDTGGAPYALFSYLGLLPWSFFSTSISQGSLSLTSNVSLLNKVYCPREVFPFASVIVATVDMVVSTTALLLLFAVTQYAPKATSVYAPLFLLIQIAFTLGVTLILSSVVVYLRDLRHALPILLQLGLFATPVAYGMSFVPEAYRVPYVIVNPLAAVIDGYRRTVLLGQPPDWHLTVPAAASALVLLVGGYVFFKRLETGMADVA